MDRIWILISEDGRQGQAEENDSNPYELDSNLDFREFARTTGFESSSNRFKSLSEKEIEIKAKDSNPHKKDSILFKEFSSKK